MRKKTFFFGNGINRVSKEAVSWSELLNELDESGCGGYKSIPYTMNYERLFLEMKLGSNFKNIREVEEGVKNKIAKALDLQDGNEVYKLMGEKKFQNYITTNYDYSFEKSIGVKPEKIRSEEIYSIRRKRKYVDGKREWFLWNIHGEIEAQKSIMIGLDHYCGSIGKIDAYIKGKYVYHMDGKEVNVKSMMEKIKGGEFQGDSWVELFFNSDIYFIGFSLDYSEIDIWWVLNKRARISREVDGGLGNRVYFYDFDICPEKRRLLQSFDVEVREMKSELGYLDGYKKAISEMS
ncbi:hypothetical protein BVZ31_05970 [Alcaligenes faecalis]|uniref:hypothetical protein n=1 Tax=Alcaligenes faecalis TaxID=511 RepID=UPI000A2EB3F3|nr:hypothetical protein [Alcaligenes faecalis]OSZ46148.1 hypothetical protein BVZ30_04115 [Alcaligenes faecalis]OSZ51172.1 hypothetical protein BVZ31_05970 [Alcaligenes faecalis]OSZ53539.1 hypothetical protein BVZ32_08845 [Alcaligenes faecalis]